LLIGCGGSFVIDPGNLVVAVANGRWFPCLRRQVGEPADIFDMLVAMSAAVPLAASAARCLRRAQPRQRQ
jgi:hypothetical protein